MKTEPFMKLSRQHAWLSARFNQHQQSLLSNRFFFSLSVYANTLFFFVARIEAHRALELLEDYHSRLGGQQDRALRIAIERVIRIFKSRLFQALLGE